MADLKACTNCFRNLIIHFKVCSFDEGLGSKFNQHVKNERIFVNVLMLNGKTFDIKVV